MQPRPCSVQVRKCIEGRIPHRKAEETAVYTRGTPSSNSTSVVGGGQTEKCYLMKGQLFPQPLSSLHLDYPSETGRVRLVFEDLD